MKSVMLSIVTPCYNESGCIHELHRRLTAAAQGAVESYEIIFINDGSTDSTWEEMQALAALDKNLVGINLSRNHGQQAALTAGLDLSRGDYILILDADLQDPPELLPELLQTLQEAQADVVYAVRRARAGENIAKKATSALFYRLLAKLTDTDIPLDTGDFRLMTRRALDTFLSMPEQARFIRGMVSWIGFKQVPLAYDRDERFAGNTNYGFVKLLKLALDAITGFSTAPLRFASHAGLLLTGAAGFLVIYILYGWLRGHAVSGWPSLMLTIVMIGAVQMWVLGMIGEYLGRLYMQSKGRPLYIVSDVIGKARKGARLGHRADEQSAN
jgi:polyisoprenyl-phosphate glycosyltransferase